ncbi:hypothetical protein B0H63DRAFT_504076 [Podospora didyma]|uniref:Aminoglycoside phosphotransferase domain-containing protein n=1 Tax=Podospora didyma TaxID=330526 RepID=A0AAE0K698_9PEZI|nr:hypothetical protein B0H63DRAFT_504076 [Podospora didyma]
MSTLHDQPADPISVLNWKTADISRVTSLPINWSALKNRALESQRAQWKESSTPPPFSTCAFLPHHNVGGLHFFRLLEFDDGERWVARIQLHGGTQESSERLVHEVDTLFLIRERTHIPVPRVFGYETEPSNRVSLPYFLMEFVPGSTAMDAFGGWDVHRGEIPRQHKDFFCQQVAKIQPRLGSARQVPMLEEQLKAHLPKGLETELRSSIQDFPSRLAEVASHVSFNEGPFPLYHTDFPHRNIIIHTDCKILREVVEFPLFLSTTPTPPPMDAPWNYDEAGADRDDYVLLAREAEGELGLDHRLSATLEDRNMQNLAGALKLFVDPGKIGFYCRMLEKFPANADIVSHDSTEVIRAQG